MIAKSRVTFILFVFSIATYNNSFGKENPSISFDGIKIFVTDLSESKIFYSNVLGFEVELENNEEIKLKTNSFPIYLYKATIKKPRNISTEAHVGLSLETEKLLPTIDKMRKLKVKFHDLELVRNGVGIAIPFEDPSGNIIHIIEVQIKEVPEFEGLRVYNSGVSVKELSKAIDFYETTLGFGEWSRDFLPNALPLKHKDGSFAFMLHHKNSLVSNSSKYGSTPSMSLVFNTLNISEFESYLNIKNIHFEKIKNTLILYDLEGNSHEIRGNKN